MDYQYDLFDSITMKNILKTPLKIPFARMTLLTVSVVFVLTSSSFAQGWERTYSEGNYEQTTTTKDGGFVLSGIQFNPSPKLTLTKLDVDGDLQWEKQYYEGGGTDIEIIADGNILLVGKEFSNGYQYNFSKIDLSGKVIWEKKYPVPSGGSPYARVEQTADGGFVASSEASASGTFYLFKLDGNGDFEWDFIDTATTGDKCREVLINTDNSYTLIGQSAFQKGDAKLMVVDTAGNKIMERFYGDSTKQTNIFATRSNDGGIILCGVNEEVDVWLLKMDANYNELWSKTIPLQSRQSVRGLAETPDSGIVVIGDHYDGNANASAFIAKTDLLGNQVWTKFYPPNSQTYLNNVTISNDGYIVCSGTKVNQFPFQNLKYAIKLDLNGYTYESFINGTIAIDSNLNCKVEPLETSLNNWLVKAQGTQTYYGITDTAGNYLINLDSGNYVLTAIPPNYIWQSCLASYPVSVPFKDTATTDISVQGEECIHMKVDISTPLLRRCFDNIYTVSYCNLGSIPSPNSFVHIEFDSFLVVNSSSLPWTSQSGNLYTFWLGNLNSNECGSFTLNVTVDCSAILGQTHCVEAHIFPDSICTPYGIGWDGAITFLETLCEPDSITFLIENIGQNPMSTPQNFIIIEDNIIMKTGEFQLTPGEILPLKVPTNGSTYRLNAGQSPGHFPPDYEPTIAIEGCGFNSNQQFSTGFVSSYSEADVLDYISIDCQQNIGAYDPNDKRAEPTGHGPEHYIEVGDDLEYHIRFQNTGTDTAFTVAIRDTISQYLDASSIVPGCSSHSYDFQIVGSNILKFTFNNILLVDSTTNEPASHGFVKFRISQIDSLPLGTIIFNNAAIYFDFNEPIITNETFHEIGKDFLFLCHSNTICQEISQHPSSPIGLFDCDGDGVTNADECNDNTDPLDACSFKYASITLIITSDQSDCAPPCTDLSPVVRIVPGTVSGYSLVQIAVEVTEINGINTDGTEISVRMPYDPRLLFVWDIGLTHAAFVPVQNASWNYQGDNELFHSFIYNGPGLSINANATVAFGLMAYYDPEGTDGHTTISATIVPMSGGECNYFNNSDSEKLIYFD